jgi:hypothetical protein
MSSKVHGGGSSKGALNRKVVGKSHGSATALLNENQRMPGPPLELIQQHQQQVLTPSKININGI